MAQSLVKSGSKLSLLTFISRILGLVREMTKASFLGTSALSDAFTVAFIIPNLLRRLFAENSISVAFIPTFRHYLEADNKTEIKDFLSAVFTLVSFLTTVVVIIGILIAPLIIPFFGTATSETILLTRIMFPYLAVISIAAFFQGILNSIRIFSPSGFTPILFNLCVIGCTYLLHEKAGNPARAMAIGVLIGGIIQAGFQLPFVLKSGFRFFFVSLKKAFSNPGTRTVLKLIAPTIIGMAAYQLNDLVSTLLAGNAGPGVVSSLQYSLRLQELILGIFAVSIGTVILPDLSGLAARKNWESFNTLLLQAMNTIALITIPITFFSLVSGENIIILLFKNRNFSEESVFLTLTAFNWHISGLYFIALNRIIAPAFYAQQDTKSPTIAGVVSFSVNIIMAILLVKPMRGGGIALALSFASAANTVLLVFFLQKKDPEAFRKIIVPTLLYAVKMLVFSVIAALPVWYFKSAIYQPFASLGRIAGQTIPLICSALIFGLVGIILLKISRDPILGRVAAAVGGKLRKTKDTDKDKTDSGEN
ncbi:murein biosynthesis integral membrane protein MurJ [Brucepastera parasyntrophica]|uniref:murein biosynthesis integral membrane protein MurJ n=1 Tax=Brucepastera parasyntrophica TaxID=2880008 RepID=UPI00210E84D1|nr:murein biosynthesis integral membrane protein MurJ [Brucepastera parasyntrophica]ULQ59390.1 murein biosynthesis integral membrane protein MurJ [Brucepastera parasyntrophica]